MRVCITEKPSVARDIAQIIGAPTKRDGYFEGQDVKVTWTFGHLCTLKEPADYTDLWKRWSLGSLPMIPEKFGIKLIDQASIKHQFSVIKSLVEQADEVVNCGDAGQEGELIQRWVMQKAGVKCPVLRLWISSLTDDAIREGFRHLKPQSDYDNLYFAGLSRAIGDWILGLNATRLYSLKYSPGGGVLSIGRVQTPTLALIVKRFKEITEFKPEDYWELKTVYRDTTFSATEGKFKSEDEAHKAIEEIKNNPIVITDIKQKSGKEAPPRLFDLTSLQVECNKRWGWTADETLKLIQSLYEKKVTTYPRVDTTYLSDDIYNKVPDILKRMTPYEKFTGLLLSKKLPKSKKVFDSSKVTDHHAIIPTGESPSTLYGDEKKMYHLIAMRFIAAFYPDCLFETTSVEAKVGKIGFKANGKVITSPGWREILLPAQEDSKGNDDEATLPEFTVGESGNHEPALQKKTTQPPKYYTEGTLLRAMEGAGKLVDEESLREALKENGIGRPSTRAAIIETLFKRNYLKRERKNILPTQAGIDLIATIKDPLLKSAELTGIWENQLRRIERGDFSAGEFVNELKAMINTIVVEVLSDNTSARIEIKAPEEVKKASAKSTVQAEKKPRKPSIKSLEAIQCPVCGSGHLLKGKQAYGCSRFREGCTMLLSFEEYPADITPAALAKLIKKNFKK